MHYSPIEISINLKNSDFSFDWFLSLEISINYTFMSEILSVTLEHHRSATFCRRSEDVCVCNLYFLHFINTAVRKWTFACAKGKEKETRGNVVPPKVSNCRETPKVAGERSRKEAWRDISQYESPIERLLYRPDLSWTLCAPLILYVQFIIRLSVNVAAFKEDTV